MELIILSVYRICDTILLQQGEWEGLGTDMSKMDTPNFSCATKKET
uniref:Uncharacterized protein n=1 Tax=Anguilla anguilla TaxID=7936 RepID=A0A0E9WNL4_ANGAN